jgi:hypothetical protein
MILAWICAIAIVGILAFLLYDIAWRDCFGFMKEPFLMPVPPISFSDFRKKS